MKNILISPKISINTKRREINDKLDHALIKWLISNSYNPIIISNKTTILKKKKLYNFLTSLKLKGIVLSGGNDVKKKSIRYKFQSLLVDYSLLNMTPILGICHGMQFLGVKFGSNLKKVKNHVRKNHKLINLTKEKFPKKVNSYHDYSLKSCPKNFFITTKSVDGNIESIKHKKFSWEGWMWHPERDQKVNAINNIRLKKIFK